jgi:hypothetical protein
MITGGNAQRLFAGKLIAAILDARDILEIGTPQRFAKELRRYGGLFEGRRYVAAGYHPLLVYGPYNCDCHQDIQAMTFPDAAFDAALCDVLGEGGGRRLHYPGVGPDKTVLLRQLAHMHSVSVAAAGQARDLSRIQAPTSDRTIRAIDFRATS